MKTLDRGRSISNQEDSGALAARITYKASKQAYLTVRWLVDKDRVVDAYRAYAYFRWVDDTLDHKNLHQNRMEFLDRQIDLLQHCYRGEVVRDVSLEEQMLVDLVANNPNQDGGLRTYLHKMMAVMSFDAHRRGRLISQGELDGYVQTLAAAVTEALHYFIGHGCRAPKGEARYQAAMAAHVVHMLRDTYEDNQAGYFNIPREIISASGVTPLAVESPIYRAWVRKRVLLAHKHICVGKAYLAQVESFRCRVAGYAYIGRFEDILASIESEAYLLRPDYPERKSLESVGRVLLASLWQALRRQRRVAKQGRSRARVKESFS